MSLKAIIAIAALGITSLDVLIWCVAHFAFAMPEALAFLAVTVANLLIPLAVLIVGIVRLGRYK